MRYRAEIDGLRALAVVPVIFFHAGFWPFSGGFVGVDVFFVISGFLITTILIRDLAEGKYSIVRFYERRARRILPALFLVIAVTTVFCYLWMLPDELKRYGQSVVATILFSNNILLTFTSGYWELASDFKPMLHTWSLGVEEQYYILFPLFLWLGWRYFRRALLPSLVVIGIVSLALAAWGVQRYPDATFYLLPTRAWELAIGSVAAFALDARGGRVYTGLPAQILSGLGLLMVLGASIFFTRNTPTPGLTTLIPTVGAAFVILFANERTVANRLLSLKPVVAIGLVSYSAYLWHNPLFVLARIYSVEPPGWMILAALIFATFVLSYLSWRYVEQPFRARGAFSPRFILVFSVVGSLLFIAIGAYFNVSRGVPGRMYAASGMQFDDMYKSYNQGALNYKKDAFVAPDKLHLLILGNSFGRDFVNMTLENFDTKRIEIVYRDDFPQCLSEAKDGVAEQLLSQASLIVISYDIFEPSCVAPNVDFAAAQGKTLFYIGTKHFGANLNWLIRLPSGERADQYNTVPPETLDVEQLMAATVPPANFISLMAPIRKGDMIPITDDAGHLISPDRMHLTRQGAIFIGSHALKTSAFGRYLERWQ